MKKKAIHQNLNTSFVNVGALVRYLTALQFVGSIRIELSSYEADIIFTHSKTIIGREYDHIAGRISHGAHALQRILIRAKEPHGRIHVYKAVAGYSGGDDRSVFVDKKIASKARDMASSLGGASKDVRGLKFMRKTRGGESAMVLEALSELLRAIDESLAKGKLSFPAAFRVACEGIAREFPFLQRSRSALVYQNGEITLNTDADTKLVSSAVFSALRPIVRRLRSEEKYSEILKIMSERLIELSATRRSDFVRFGLTTYVEELLAAD